MSTRLLNHCFAALTLAALVLPAAGYAQMNSVSSGSGQTWVANSASLPSAFVENKGQYLPFMPKAAADVVYGVENGIKAYFMHTGVIYELGKREVMSRKEREEYESLIREVGRDAKGEEEEELKNKTVLHRSFVGLEWEGANPSATIVPEGRTSGYYNFLNPSDFNKVISNCYGYRQITYKDLYPNIDLVYVFHQNGGVKYSLILHPGADISQVKMKYRGAKSITLGKDGTLTIKAENGEITDHAPVTFYDSDHTPISSGFVVNGKTVSFSLGSFDHSRTVVLDPWTVTNFAPVFAPLEVAHDAPNDAFVLGQNTANDKYVMKYDVNGVFQWSVQLNVASNSGYDGYIGDIDADPAGNSYISKGLALSPLGSGDMKLDPLGNVVWNNGVSPFMYENWRITFNCDYSQLLNSGCGPSCCNGGRIDLCDPITGVESGFVAPSTAGDMVCTCFGQNGLMYNVNVNNSIICLNPAAGFSVVFDVPNPYGLTDGIQTQGGGGPLGMNGIAAGCNFFYVFLGQTLEKRDLATGALITSVNVPGGSFLLNMGIAVDKCGNVYAGSNNAIYIYDPNLVQLASYPTPSAVNDIALANNGIVYAVGGNIASNTGFLAQFNVFSICQNGITTSVTNASCSGGLGSATVTANFCSPPYTYQWDAATGNQTGQTATNLPAGTYSCIVTGAGACNEVDTAVVTITGSGLAFTMTSTPSNCTGNTGSATATPSSAGQFTYTWNTTPVQTNQTATSLPSGYAVVTVTDTSGCTATDSIMVGLIGGFPTTMNFTSPDCFGATNGSATVTPNGGTGPYSYSWNTTPVQTNQTAANIGAGTYIVTVTDSTGCSTQDTVQLTQPTQVTASITFNPPACFGDLNGDATVTGAGGGGQYTYLWVTTPVQTTQTATGLGAGNYSVVVTDSAGCPATANVTITQPAALGATMSAVPPSVCLGGCSTISGNITGGTPGYTYNWMPGSLAGSSNSVCPPATTTYTLTTTDANGCSRIDSVTVTVLLPPVISFTADTFQGCAPLCVNFTNNTPNTQSAVWFYGDGPAFGTSPNYCYPPGTFDVSLIVVGTNGCSDTLTQLAYIQAFPSPTASFVAPTMPISEWESMVCFTDASTGAVSWSWNFNDPNDPTGSTDQDPCHDFAATGTYCVDLLVTNANGCTDTTEECIEIYPETTLYIPNAFTPNGSGPNELFMPVGIGITNENYKFMVFDRWGMLIYESNTWGEGWDGTFKGNPCQEDVYVWKLRCIDVLGKKHTLIGHVSLIR